jgi:acyl-CoA thioester hydrolase
MNPDMTRDNAAGGANGGAEVQGWVYTLPYEVRDYELDLQGIVNNSVYLNYFEHARHTYLRSLGIDFAQLHAQGLDAVVHRIEIDYLNSLLPGEKFVVRLRVEMKGRLRIVFAQEAVKESGVAAARSRVETVITKNGRPVPPDPWMIERLFPKA